MFFTQHYDFLKPLYPNITLEMLANKTFIEHRIKESNELSAVIVVNYYTFDYILCGCI